MLIYLGIYVRQVIPGICGDRKYDVLTELIIGELIIGGIQMCTGDIIGIRLELGTR